MSAFLKNIPYSAAVDYAGLVQVQSGQVVSRTLAQGKNISLTLFAFDANEEISSHASKGDALVHALEGSVCITIGDQQHTLTTGQAIVMPAGIPHALKAITPFKMMLTVVFHVD